MSINKEVLDSFTAYSLRFADVRVVHETLDSLGRHDIEVKTEDGEWVRIGELIDDDAILELNGKSRRDS